MAEKKDPKDPPIHMLPPLTAVGLVKYGLKAVPAEGLPVDPLDVKALEAEGWTIATPELVAARAQKPETPQERRKREAAQASPAPASKTKPAPKKED